MKPVDSCNSPKALCVVAARESLVDTTQSDESEMVSNAKHHHCLVVAACIIAKVGNGRRCGHHLASFRVNSVAGGLLIGRQSIQVSALGQRVVRAKTDLVVAGVDVVAAALRVVVADPELDGSVQLVVNERLRRVEPGAVVRAWGSGIVAVVDVAIGSAQRNRTDCIGTGGADDLQRGCRNKRTVDSRRVETVEVKPSYVEDVPSLFARR